MSILPSAFHLHLHFPMKVIGHLLLFSFLVLPFCSIVYFSSPIRARRSSFMKEVYPLLFIPLTQPPLIIIIRSAIIVMLSRRAGFPPLFKAFIGNLYYILIGR